LKKIIGSICEIKKKDRSTTIPIGESGVQKKVEALFLLSRLSYFQEFNAAKNSAAQLPTDISPLFTNPLPVVRVPSICHVAVPTAVPTVTFVTGTVISWVTSP
jgi:hypothetical protein